MTEDEILELLKIAKQVEKNAYVPFSNRPNGVALLSKDGQIYTGCTVEISNFASSVCAAKVALVKAISEGVTDFIAIAITGPNVDISYLCGNCRQSLAEFNLDIMVISELDPSKVKSLGSLLPEIFSFRK